MAAMLVQGSKCLPRYVGRLTLIRNSPWKRKITSLAKEKNPLLNASRQAASLKQCENWELLQNVSKLPLGSGSRHRFHQSTVFCDEFKIVNTPAFAESVTEGDVRWEKAVGDYVKEDDVICEIETDKTSIPVPSPAAGFVEELFVPDGERVEPGQQLFKLKLSGDAPAAAAGAEKVAAEPAPAATSAPEAASATGSGPIPTTPPPVQPLPSAPTASVPVAAIKPTPAAPQSTGAPRGGGRTETRVKMNRMRLRIAERLKDAQNTCAMLTTFNEIDMSNIMDMRSCYKDAFQKKYGMKLGFMSAFVKASAFALEDQPAVNAVIDDKEIVYRDYIDISVAVSTPKGLVVPVLRNVSNMNYADIELEIAALGEKARTGALAIEDMDGGTFTISNGGVFGSLFGTPIINPPQSAILGMHRIDQKAVVINGKIEIRPMMYVALTYDHRLIDGREAVTFLRKIKSAIEDPRVLLLNL
ncbi:dihydrolipoyllysine-residue succinyltransferase component of 2-oxoglutarate dehydrogenase complex, mitochondrial-like [Pecten maximus]|uniref:dihydrolipoyllysine-residue succinyltransferase component of 2-oxoglutarate dehydrogenase complex, mitochondrial-like n=1 Tax=Pecten maximus TaxID=6579 RepID=UPI001458B39D|nr:dihydrolipoyllysine-residue succinyltransferase component of 2-oxoglutarate dehydrogenase complex, mitochondrial-like [Pecten maximus]